MFKKLCVVAVLSLTLFGCESNNQTAGTAIGGVTGALIGSQIGGGNGRILGTALGATAGALVGSEIGKSMDNQ